MARDRIIVQRYALGGQRYREDPLSGFTSDAAAWTMANDIAEKHVAGWLFQLAGRPVEDFELATLVRVEGLTRKRPHPEGVFTWQCEGAALLIAAGLDTYGLDVYLSDYRTAAGRIDRKRDASSIRAAQICREMEAGVHPRDAIARHKPARVPALVNVHDRPVPEDTAAQLAYYRGLVVSGEVSD